MAGLEGSLLMMIGHGVVSPGLFLCVGILYDRYKTRVVHYYGGLAQTMPLFACALLILTMANISLPALSPTFAAELLIFHGRFFGKQIGVPFGHVINGVNRGVCLVSVLPISFW